MVNTPNPGATRTVLAAKNGQHATVASEQKLRQKVSAIRAGEYVFKEGDTSTDFYLLLKGSVEILKGEQLIAKIDEPNSYFGEMAALLGEPRTASVRVATDAQFLIIPGDKFDSVIDLSPAMGKRLMKALSKRLQDTNSKLIGTEAELKKVKAGRLQEQLDAAQDYKRLVYVIALLFKELRLPQIKDLYEYAKDSSSLAKIACKLDLELRHFDRYQSVRKLVEKEQSSRPVSPS